MEKTREIRTIRSSLITRSTRKFETIRIGMTTGLETDGVTMNFYCKDPYSPVEMNLFLDERSKDFMDIITITRRLTHEIGAQMIRAARQEQRYGGDNVGNPHQHTEQVVSALVIAHLAPHVDFSFANLKPHTIDNLKILALEHESTFSNSKIA